jgi:DNA-directed RNA polymerase subunit K
MAEKQIFTKYEEARIIGARALQLAMNAPLLVKISEADLEKIHFDALKIAEVELKSGVLPISVKKPFPVKKEGALKKPITPKISDKKKIELEEAELEEQGEIMELAKPDDEDESGEKVADGKEELE